MTKVVNVYYHAYDVYVGNPQGGTDPRELQPGEYGFLGNPWNHLSDPGEAQRKYEKYFLQRVRKDRRFRLAVLSLQGQRLGCFCEEGQGCHADFLKRWLEAQALASRQRSKHRA